MKTEWVKTFVVKCGHSTSLRTFRQRRRGIRAGNVLPKFLYCSIHKNSQYFFCAPEPCRPFAISIPPTRQKKQEKEIPSIYVSCLLPAWHGLSHANLIYPLRSPPKKKFILNFWQLCNGEESDIGFCLEGFRIHRPAVSLHDHQTKN